MIIILELLFGAENNSPYGQAVGLNMENHLGAIPTTPLICDILIPTSISRLDVRVGSRMSKYMRLFPT